jgi:hypothetical protein
MRYAAPVVGAKEECVSVSAELRWFWKEAPAGLESWFRSGPFPPGGGTPREDEYLLNASQVDLGVKKRGAKAGVEVKGLVGLGGTSQRPFEGRVQIWGKWSVETLALDRLPRVKVHKTRWLRKYDTSGTGISEVELDADEQQRRAPDGPLERGCQLEFVALRVGGAAGAWWSLGFEAFGDLSDVEQSLHRTVAHLAPTAPSLADGLELSYPQWLARFGTSRGDS